MTFKKVWIYQRVHHIVESIFSLFLGKGSVNILREKKLVQTHRRVNLLVPYQV